MRKKNLFKFSFSCFFLFCLISAGFTGCRTQPTVLDPNEAIIGGMVSMERLRIINERALGILDEFQQFFEVQSDRLGRGAIDFRTALREYDEFVISLIRRIEELEELSRGVDEEILSRTNTAYHFIIALLDKYNGKNYYSHLAKAGG